MYTIPKPRYQSKRHFAIVAQAAEDRGCSCIPYVNWATYKIWRDVGRQVQAGQSGISLVSYPTQARKNKKTGKKEFYKIRRGYTVFCECQTKEVK